jgi:hypothetical protein
LWVQILPCRPVLTIFLLLGTVWIAQIGIGAWDHSPPQAEETNYSGIAQAVERLICNEKREGSIPSAGTSYGSADRPSDEGGKGSIFSTTANYSALAHR